MNARHVYRPPRRNRFLSTAIIFGGGGILTFMVFYFIPLMQRLEQGLRPPPEDLVVAVAPEQPDEYVEPEPEEEIEEEVKEPEIAEANEEIDVEPMNLADLQLGTGGRVLLNVTPAVALGGGGGMESTGVDSDPVVSSKAPLSVPGSARKALEKRGTVRIIVSGLIDENGKLLEAKISKGSGIPALDQAAVKAVRKYKFKAAVRNGRKAKARIKIPFEVRVG
jgi:protein TonB